MSLNDGILQALNDLKDRWWIPQAACRDTDPDTFFPSQPDSAGQTGAKGLEAARTICRTCPVQPECLEYALTHHEKFGVWGGTSERERRKIRRARANGDPTAGRMPPTPNQESA
jgi:WhiB family transcriptional regulator, redox-sensing transcriptional regulator